MLVSIIVPAYNVEKYIEETISSIINQSYENIEILVIDDGSTDNTLNILKKLKEKHPIIRLFEQTNKGLSRTRNRGINASTGDCLVFIDGDDILEPSAIELCIEKINNNNVDMVIYDAKAFFDNDFYSKELSKFTYKRNDSLYNKVLNGEDFFNNCIKLNCYISSSCLFVVKKQSIKGLVFHNDIYHEDHLFTTRVLLSGVKVYLINSYFYNRRFRSDSIMTEEKNSKHAFGYYTVAKELISCFEKEVLTNRYLNKYICDLIFGAIEIASYDHIKNTEIIKKSKSLFNDKLNKSIKYIIKIKFHSIFKLVKRFIG